MRAASRSRRLLHTPTIIGGSLLDANSPGDGLVVAGSRGSPRRGESPAGTVSSAPWFPTGSLAVPERFGRGTITPSRSTPELQKPRATRAGVRCHGSPTVPDHSEPGAFAESRRTFLSHRPLRSGSSIQGDSAPS